MNENRLIQQALLAYADMQAKEARYVKWSGVLHKEHRMKLNAQAKQARELAITYGRKADAQG